MCVEGVEGPRCDKCTRGYSGVFPDCTPCHQCFALWDVIIAELTNRTQKFLEKAKALKISGVIGPYRETVDSVEKKVNEIRDILAQSPAAEPLKNPPAPPRPRPRAAPRSPRPPGLAGLAAHHPRARPELRRSCPWRDEKVQASPPTGPRMALRRTTAAKPAGPARRTCRGPKQPGLGVPAAPGAPATSAPHPGPRSEELFKDAFFQAM